MSDYAAVVANALANSAVWSGDRLNVTTCSNAVVRELVPRIEEDTRRKHRQELLDELIADLGPGSMKFLTDDDSGYFMDGEVRMWLEGLREQEAE